MFIDPAEYFAKLIKNDLGSTAGNGRGKCEKFYVSANPENFVNAAKMFYDIKEGQLSLVDLRP
jgi:hypothetical protein